MKSDAGIPVPLFLIGSSQAGSIQRRRGEFLSFLSGAATLGECEEVDFCLLTLDVAVCDIFVMGRLFSGGPDEA